MHIIEYTSQNNERHILLDDLGAVKKFKSARNARDYLRDIGVRKPEKEGYQILPVSAPELVAA